MLINLRNALMSGARTPTAKDYVQSGLVAMWDGIENAGWGTHDPNATVWKDLVGGNDFTLTNCPIGLDDVRFLGNTSHAVAPTYIASGGVNVPSCVEIVCERTNSTAELCIIAFQAAGSSVANFIYLYQGKVAYAHATRENTSCAATSTNSWQTRSMTFNYPSSVFFNGQSQVAQTNEDYFGVNVTGGVVINPRSSYPFAGSIKAIRYYSRALTADEIARNYAIDKARFHLP